MLQMELFSKKKTNNFLLDHMIELLLLGMIIGISINSPAFLTRNNVLNIFRNMAMKGVIAYGMCLVIIAGEIDLSIGSMVGLSGVVVGWTAKFLLSKGIPIEYGAFIGIILAFAIGIVFGTFHAWARHKFNMPTFIITLATLNIMYGLAALICKGFPIVNAFPKWYIFIGTGKILGVPFPAIILLIMFFIYNFISRKLDLGREIYAVGGNAEASRLNGISVWKTRVVVLCSIQVMCVLAGIMDSAQVRSATFGFGRGWEVAVISSVVIGGTSMLGGIGTIWGTLIGILFTGIIANAMTLLNVNEFMQYVVNGSLMFGAVMFNTYMKRKRS